MSERDQLTGSVERITYYDEENGHTLQRLKPALAVVDVSTESPLGVVRRPAGVVGAVLVGVLLISMAACRPTALSLETATTAATTTTISSAIPAPTLTPPPATATIAPTTTLPPLATLWPTETPFPTVLPTSTPSPQPTLPVYENVKIYAYIRDESRLEVGYSEGWVPSLLTNPTYSAANEVLAAELKTLIEGDIFVILTGDYYPPTEGSGHLVVEDFEYVSQLYTPETPFDTVFQQPGFNFSFRYPPGWFVEIQKEDVGGNSVRLSNAPFAANQLRPGREAFDPSWYYLTLHFEPVSLEAYVAARQDAVEQDSSPDGPATFEVIYWEMGGRSVAQIIRTRMYRNVTYVVSWEGGVVVISPSAESGGKDDIEFIRRLVESME